MAQIEEAVKPVKEINIRLPRSKRLQLSPRARFVWGRLVRLQFHSSALKLVGHCGGLVGRSDGLKAALAELTKAKLVERQGTRGWIALEPTGENAEQFEWPRKLAHLSRWQDKFLYTSVTVPVIYPFAGWDMTTEKGKKIVTPENALEVWLVWECLKGKTKAEFPKVSLLAPSSRNPSTHRSQADQKHSVLGRHDSHLLGKRFVDAIAGQTPNAQHPHQNPVDQASG